MVAMSGIRKYPQSLKLAMQATHQKPDHFYETAQNLSKSRKRSAVKTQQRHTVLNVLKRLGL